MNQGCSVTLPSRCCHAAGKCGLQFFCTGDIIDNKYIIWKIFKTVKADYCLPGYLEKTMQKKTKFKISPMAVIIASVITAVICIIVIVVLGNLSGQDDMFSEDYKRTEATCTNKEISSGNNGRIYFIDLTFYAKNHISEEDTQYNVRISETDPKLADVDQGQTIDIYYKTANPSYCHPVMIYPDYTVITIILWIIVGGCVVAAGINLSTVMRNKNGYVPTYEKPEDIGTFGDVGADSGLSDKKIDYSAGDVFSDNLMDSYVDPFATYTGYDEENTAQDSGGFDPNAGYSNPEPYQQEQPNSGMDEDSLNNPFATQINNDPSNPYNTGTYSSPTSRFGSDSNYNSAEIYGDSSFGSRDDYNSTEIYGSSTFGVPPADQNDEG